MPHIDTGISAQGAFLNVAIAVSNLRQHALQSAGLQVPAPVRTQLLVDTGASSTAVDAGILQQLQIPAHAVVPIHTPSTQGVPHQANLHDIALGIFGQQAGTFAYSIQAIPVISGAFLSQGIGGLIGRDILASCRMTYGGPNNAVWLSF